MPEGSVVRLGYTMRDDAGEVLDASSDGEPLVFTQGQHQVIAGLERTVTGMGVGEEKRVTVAPEDAYGTVDPEAEVLPENIPVDAQSPGQPLVARSPDGSTRVVRVNHFAVRAVAIDGPATR